MSAVEIEVEGRRLRLSSLDRVLWPAAGATKGDLLDYYRAAAPALLPHVAGRPVYLRRFPEGVEGPGWYQNECRGRPEWLRALPLADSRGKVWNFCVVDDLPSLLWVANLGTIELHPLLGRPGRPDEPAAVVFDLDPRPPADVLACCRVALALRAELAALGLDSFPKTSGSVGLHVSVPLAPGATFERSRGFARALAERLAAERPGEVVAEKPLARRTGKVLVDWTQNGRTRSLAAPYSLRATAWPTVSTPLAWEEVEEAPARRRPELLTFRAADALARLGRDGDRFLPVLTLAQPLPALG